MILARWLKSGHETQRAIDLSKNYFIAEDYMFRYRLLDEGLTTQKTFSKHIGKPIKFIKLFKCKEEQNG